MLPNQANRMVRKFIAFSIVSALVTATLLSPSSLMRAVRAEPGDLDVGFGENGSVKLPVGPSGFGVGTRVAIQADGKIIAAHVRTILGFKFLQVTRHLPDGEREWSRSLFFTTAQLVVKEALIRSDGKILVSFTIGGNSTVLLLGTSGLRDDSFGSEGRLNPGQFEDVEFMPDNRLVILSQTQLRVYDPDGILVQTINLPYPSTAGHGRLALAPDGRLVVASTSVLTRYNSDMTPDATFCSGGPCPSPISIQHLAVAKDSKIVTGGFTGSARFVARHLESGDVDIAFGVSGVVQVSPTGSFESLVALEIDDSGRILVQIQEFLPFGRIVVIAFNGSSIQHLTGTLAPAGMALQQDGKIVAAVNYANLAAIVQRYHYADEGNSADLQIDTIAIAPARGVSPGDEVEYTISVTNNGKNKAGYLTFENPVPNGATFVSLEAPEGWIIYQRPKFIFGKVSCSGYNLAAGRKVTFRLKLRVNSFTQLSQITNTATIKSLVSDPVLSNNTTSTTVPVQ